MPPRKKRRIEYGASGRPSRIEKEEAKKRIEDWRKNQVGADGIDEKDLQSSNPNKRTLQNDKTQEQAKRRAKRRKVDKPLETWSDDELARFISENHVHVPGMVLRRKSILAIRTYKARQDKPDVRCTKPDNVRSHSTQVTPVKKPERPKRQTSSEGKSRPQTYYTPSSPIGRNTAVTPPAAPGPGPAGCPAAHPGSTPPPPPPPPPPPVPVSVAVAVPLIRAEEEKKRERLQQRERLRKIENFEMSIAWKLGLCVGYFVNSKQVPAFRKERSLLNTERGEARWKEKYDLVEEERVEDAFEMRKVIVERAVKIYDKLEQVTWGLGSIAVCWVFKSSFLELPPGLGKVVESFLE